MAEAAELIGKISKVEDSSKNLQNLLEKQIPHLMPSTPPNAAYFEALMQGKVTKYDQTNHSRQQPLPYENHIEGVRDNLNAAQNPNSDKRVSVMDEASRVSAKIKTIEFFNQSPDERIQFIQNHADKAISQIENIKGTLSNPNLHLKNSVSYLLQNKVNKVHGDLGTIYNKMGMEYQAPSSSGKILTPIKRFFGYLVNGQTQLDSLKQDVNNIDKKNFSIADMLVMQIKVAHISQELEYFSNVLNKALESTKTLMNVQV